MGEISFRTYIFLNWLYNTEWSASKLYSNTKWAEQVIFMYLGIYKNM